MIKILAISGSLRKNSYNSALLRAMIKLAPENVSVEFFYGLGELPLFNPDSEELEIPSVIHFRNQLASHDGIVIASPEYAHGVTGAMKNALDWVVGSGELVYKPVAVINAAPHATYAYASIIETLRVMTADIDPVASKVLPSAGQKLSTDEIYTHKEISNALRSTLVSLAQTIRSRDAATSSEKNASWNLF